MNMHRLPILGGAALFCALILLVPLAVQAAEKTYTDTENGFSVTLPSGWKKLKLDEPALLFNAQRNDRAAQWMLSMTPLKNKKAADGMKRSMTKQPKNFGKQVRKELNKQFGNSCAMTSAVKKTIGSFTGAMSIYDCLSRGVKVTIQFFSFVQGTKQYSGVGVTTKAGYATYKAELEMITKSVTFTE